MLSNLLSNRSRCCQEIGRFLPIRRSGTASQSMKSYTDNQGMAIALLRYFPATGSSSLCVSLKRGRFERSL